MQRPVRLISFALRGLWIATVMVAAKALIGLRWVPLKIGGGFLKVADRFTAGADALMAHARSLADETTPTEPEGDGPVGGAGGGS
ncbi:MAG: hypothetical protein AAGI03_01485 [Pseudomonadota bacterium]